MEEAVAPAPMSTQQPGGVPTSLGLAASTAAPGGLDVNTSQLHQSRFGLLSQAVMMIMTVGFMFSETLEQFWKTKVDLTSRYSFKHLHLFIL